MILTSEDSRLLAVGGGLGRTLEQRAQHDCGGALLQRKESGNLAAPYAFRAT